MSPARYEGLVVEDKEYSVTVRYQHAVHRAAARRALQEARRLAGCTHAIYVRDDDEDAFASGGPERLLAIRVGA